MTNEPTPNTAPAPPRDEGAARPFDRDDRPPRGDRVVIVVIVVIAAIVVIADAARVAVVVAAGAGRATSARPARA